MLKKSAPWLASIGLALGLAQAGVLIAPGLAIAGPDLSTDVVAPYVHMPVSISPGSGPLTTVFLIRSPKPGPVTVNIKCFNQSSQSVGPSNPKITLAMFQTFAWAPVSTFAPLDLSSSPNFTGEGWCYFSSTDKFSVEVAFGFIDPAFIVSGKVTDGNELQLLASINSVGIGIAVGQTTVAGSVPGTAVIPGVGTVPIFQRFFNWIDVLVLVNPTAASGQVTVNTFNCADCNPMPAPTPVTVSLPARGMGLVFLSNYAPSSSYGGNATIDSGGTCCFLGWHWAVNVSTRQILFREVTLDRDTSRFLGPADRP